MDTANRILRSHLSSLLLLVFISQSGSARNTISAIEPLKDGQVLTSMRDIFEVGFFSPGNSTHRYFGIWYKQLFHSKVVWVANRETPLNDSSGVVTIDRFGNLVLLDGLNNTIWSTNVSFTPMISSALLVCTGNLALNEINSTGSDYLWQSFNHPSDSLLPSMTFNYENKTRNRDCLFSWKSENDPSIGKFVLALDDSAIPQALILNGSVRHWRTAKFDQTGFVGVPTMYSNVLLGNQYLVSDIAEAQSALMYAFFSPILVLDYSGILRQMVFQAVNRSWTEDWRAPSSKCDFYNTCGPFGICSEFESRTCSCLRGFEPKIAEEWKKGNWISGRCVRRTPLQCERNDSFVNKNQQGDGFVKLKSVKLPDFSDLLRGADRKECQDRCLKNCSCVAYAFVYEVGCVVWSGDLIDIQELRIGGAELFLRLAFSDLDKKERKVKAYIIILITIAGAIILSGLAFILWRMKVKRRREQTRLMEMLASLDMLDNLGESPQAYLLQDKNRGSQELLLFDFKLITSATNQFSDKLGEGGFGPVYKGRFLDGPEIAVKRLSRSSGQGVREFKNELKLISKLQHRNLVRLLGCCIENEEKMLVYEYMPHKSLDAILFDPIKKSELDWKKRFNIIDGIARGLLYLHRDSRLKIIHRDLKASNILLDENMTPKISDFGMARIFGGDQTKANTNRVVGTYGYMSPEYAMEGMFSEKSDVFSFGVLVLEILSSRRNTSFYYLGSFVNLLGYAWQLWKEDKAMELIDPMLAVADSKLDLMRCILVGLLCVQECVADRPTMSAIVFMLGSDTILPSPKQPAFSPLQFSPTMSLNNVTMTSMGGR